MESRKEGDYSYTLCMMGLTNLDFPAHFYVDLYVCTTITAFCQNQENISRRSIPTRKMAFLQTFACKIWMF